MAALAEAQAVEAGDRKSDEAGRDNNHAGNQPSEDAGEEAEVAAKNEPNQPIEPNAAPPPPDEEGFVWPEGAAPTDAAATVAPAAENEPAPDAPLPALHELVERIPAATRETLDELFRARFVTVKRVAVSTLKS